MDDRELLEMTEQDESSTDFGDFEADWDENPIAESTEPATSAPDTEYAEQEQPVTAAPSVPAPLSQLSYGLSPMRQGLVFVVSVLVVAAGLGYGVLFALGGTLRQLVDPQALTRIDQLLKFDAHPTNLFVFIALGVILLAALGGYWIRRATDTARRRALRAERTIERIGNLDLDEPSGWQDEQLRRDTRLTEFLTTTLGSYRLLLNKQAKNVGLVGELRRLEKALDDDSRVDLQGSYEEPLVGSLADMVLAVVDERSKAQESLAATEQRYTDTGASLVASLQEAQHWNNSALDMLNLQSMAVERLAANVGHLTEAIKTADIDQHDLSHLEAGIQAIKTNLANLPAEGLDQVLTETATVFGEMGERGSKLAFQIAMEVARLGASGERLLPMTQDLEELTTEFRAMAGELKTKAADQQPVAQCLASMRGQLAGLDLGSHQDKADGAELKKLMVMASELAPMAQQAFSNLNDMARGLIEQNERLTRLGNDCADVFGGEFDAALPTNNDVGESIVGGLQTGEFDPFAPQHDSVVDGFEVADPFAAAPGSVMGDAPAVDSGIGLTHSTVPELPDSAAATTPPAATMSSDAPSADTVVAVMPDPAANPALPLEDEKVYDLSEFDAQCLDEETTGDGDGEDRIYELSELGAVALS